MIARMIEVAWWYIKFFSIMSLTDVREKLVKA